MNEKPESWTAIDSLIWPHIAANFIHEQHAEIERLREKNNRLREKNERLRQVLESLDVGDPAWKLMRAALRREDKT